jgi:oligogalacturonide lyase
LAAAGRLYGPELQRYPDPATELPVVRLTNPAFASGMTAPHLRQFGRRGDFLVHWSARDGSVQAFHLDLKTGDSRQLTDAAALDPASLSLSLDEKSVTYFDGASLRETSLNGQKTHTIAQAANRKGMTLAVDGSLCFAESSRIVRVLRQQTSVIADDAGIDLVLARPHLPQIAWRSASGWWLANLDGTGRRQLKLEPGMTGEVLWTPAGRSLIYLHIPDDSRELIALRENFPDEAQDHEVARTSQFATVSANGDASVFAGASRSKANAYVILLLRVTRRELTLCEHRASDPLMVSPVFSPDSQSVFFVSDRHGKSAVYRVQVEKFVEATG